MEGEVGGMRWVEGEVGVHCNKPARMRDCNCPSSANLLMSALRDTRL